MKKRTTRRDSLVVSALRSKGLIATLVAATCLLTLPTSARANSKSLTVKTTEALAATGLLKHIAPRFRFKSKITLKMELVPERALPDAATALDAGTALLICHEAPHEAAALSSPTGDKKVTVTALFSEATQRAATCAIIRTKGPKSDPGAQLEAWLLSASGRRAVAKLSGADGKPLFVERDAKPTVIAAVQPQNTSLIAAGEKLSLQHCGRCHVVSEKNKYGGIGSTPSFGALRTIPRWDAKFAAFWTFAPHPSFTQVEGMTDPFTDENPPHIAPIYLSLNDVEAINAFVHSIAPKDLGQPIKPN